MCIGGVFGDKHHKWHSHMNSIIKLARILVVVVGSSSIADQKTDLVINWILKGFPTENYLCSNKEVYWSRAFHAVGTILDNCQSKILLAVGASTQHCNNYNLPPLLSTTPNIITLVPHHWSQRHIPSHDHIYILYAIILLSFFAAGTEWVINQCVIIRKILITILFLVEKAPSISSKMDALGMQQTVHWCSRHCNLHTINIFAQFLVLYLTYFVFK